MGKTMCPVHKFIHGGEAEELRSAIEKFAYNLGMGQEYYGDGLREELYQLLDKIDARDSCAVRPKKRREKRSK